MSAMHLGLAFLNPWALWLLPLAAIPIIIHLLNRRRFETVPWAAMSFLLAAMKRNRRRLRMEHWLILLLRTLAVLFLVLLVARPSFDDGVFGSARRHHILVLDDSASMQHRGPAGTAFEDALEAIETYASSIAATRDGDLFTVLSGTNPDAPILPVTRVGAELPARVRDATARARVGDGTFGLLAALESARKAADADQDAEHVDFRVVTDLRKADWLGESGELEAPVVAWLKTFEGADDTVTIHGVGSKDVQNLAISGLRARERVCTAGLPLTFAVDVTNLGLDTTTAVDLAVQVDDRSRTTFEVPPLSAGETATIEFRHTFQTSGMHGVTAALPEDRLILDDSMTLAVEVRAASRVLLVDGDPGDDLEESDAFFLHAALEIRGAVNSGVEVRLVAEHELGGDELSGAGLDAFDMVWLCNVGRPSERAAKALDAFVRGGGGLVVFVGNQVDARHYDTTMFQSGDGILPAKLVTVDGDIDDKQPVHIARKDTGLFEDNIEDVEFMFQELVAVGRYFTVDDTTLPENSQVILRIGDEDGPPLLIARDVGAGRVFLSTTTADADWTSWPIFPVFVISAISIHRDAARPQDFGRRNLAASDVVNFDYDAGRQRPELTVVPAADPTGDVRTFSAQQGADGRPAESIAVPMRELTGFGLFEVQHRRHDGGLDRELLSRRAPRGEGRLERLSKTLFARSLPEELRPVVKIRDDASDASSSGAGGEAGAAQASASSDAWRLSAFALLFGMLIETLLAWRFGRR